MNILPFNQAKKNIIDYEGEAVRLSNELRSRPEKTVRDIKGNILYTIPAYNGFDIETCPVIDIINWIESTTVPKSKALEAFVLRVFSVRFPAVFDSYSIRNDLNLEKNLIGKSRKNDVSWFGEVGFIGKTRLDGSINTEIGSFIKPKDQEKLRNGKTTILD